MIVGLQPKNAIRKAMIDKKHLPAGDGGTKAKAEAMHVKRTKIVFIVVTVLKEI
jgi:hypothetical protein